MNWGKVYGTDEEMVASERDWFQYWRRRYAIWNRLSSMGKQPVVEVAFAISKYLAVALIHERTLGIDLPVSFYSDLASATERMNR